MDELRAVFEGLSYSGVATLLASGNVVFEAPEEEGLRGEEGSLREEGLLGRKDRRAPTVGFAPLERPDDRFVTLEREVVWLRRGQLSDAPFPLKALGAVRKLCGR